MKSYQLMIARFSNGTTCRSTAEVINSIQDANGSACTISPLLTVCRDLENGYYVAAYVGAVCPHYRQITGYYKDVCSALEAFDAIGAEPADSNFVLKYALY